MASLDLIVLVVAAAILTAGALALASMGLRWLQGTEPRARRTAPTRQLIRQHRRSSRRN